jgi:hypothetical protein
MWKTNTVYCGFHDQAKGFGTPEIDFPVISYQIHTYPSSMDRSTKREQNRVYFVTKPYFGN